MNTEETKYLAAEHMLQLKAEKITKCKLPLVFSTGYSSQQPYKQPIIQDDETMKLMALFQSCSEKSKSRAMEIFGIKADRHALNDLASKQYVIYAKWFKGKQLPNNYKDLMLIDPQIDAPLDLSEQLIIFARKVLIVHMELINKRETNPNITIKKVYALHKAAEEHTDNVPYRFKGRRLALSLVARNRAKQIHDHLFTELKCKPSKLWGYEKYKPKEEEILAMILVVDNYSDDKRPFTIPQDPEYVSIGGWVRAKNANFLLLVWDKETKTLGKILILDENSFDDAFIDMNNPIKPYFATRGAWIPEDDKNPDFLCIVTHTDRQILAFLREEYIKVINFEITEGQKGIDK